jgi:hypothetical protein
VDKDIGDLPVLIDKLETLFEMVENGEVLFVVGVDLLVERDFLWGVRDG